MRTKTVEVRGEPFVADVASHLISRSAWFQVEPLPNDWWLVTVKPEQVHALGDLPGVFIDREDATS